MDAKKAYRGAKAALRTAKRREQELKERNLALAYGARPSQKEAQAAQEYVEDLERRLDAAENEVACLQEKLISERHYIQELIYDLSDAEEEVEELKRTLHDRARQRRDELLLELGVFAVLAGVALYGYLY